MTPKVQLKTTEILSDNWYTLKKVTYEYQAGDGPTETHIREAYDRGNGAAILLYNKEQQTVILIRQFRLPTYINGNPDGMLIEVCAGLLDQDNPEDCIRKETEEETGYVVSQVEKVMDWWSKGQLQNLSATSYQAESVRPTIGLFSADRNPQDIWVTDRICDRRFIDVLPLFI